MSKNKVHTFKKTSVIINSDIDYEFRSIASRKYQFQKGWYSEAIAEAMELWIKTNEMIFSNHGVTPMTRFIGSRTWDYFKNNAFSSYNGSEIDVMENIFDYFRNSALIDDIDYNVHDDKLKCKVSLPHKLNNSKFEELVDTQIIPISFTARAGMEDIMADNFKISRIKVDNKKSKVELRKEHK